MHFIMKRSVLPAYQAPFPAMLIIFRISISQGLIIEECLGIIIKGITANAQKAARTGESVYT